MNKSISATELSLNQSGTQSAIADRNVEQQARNKALVLEALDTLLNRREYVETQWSSNLIQHSAHVPPGREGLFAMVKGAPSTLRYEPGLVVAEGNYVMVQGRYSGIGPVAKIAVDIIRVENGVCAEHWDAVEDEVSQAKSLGGYPMFGTSFPLN